MVSFIICFTMCSSTLLVTTSVFTLKLFTLYYSSSLSYNYCSLGKNKIMLVFSDRPKLIVSSITSLDKNWRSLNNSKNPIFFLKQITVVHITASLDSTTQSTMGFVQKRSLFAVQRPPTTSLKVLNY